MLPQSINTSCTRKAQILSHSKLCADLLESIRCQLCADLLQRRLDTLFALGGGGRAEEVDLTSSTAPHCGGFGRTTVHSEPIVNLFLMALWVKLENMGFL